MHSSDLYALWSQHPPAAGSWAPDSLHPGEHGKSQFYGGIFTPENTENPTIELAETSETVDSTWEQEYEKGVYLAIGIVALICLILFIVWLTQKGENNAA